MNYRAPIADPEGLLVFDQPTDVYLKGSPPNTPVTATIIPYTAVFEKDERRSSETIEVWAGDETYRIPADVNYRLVTNLESLFRPISNQPVANANQSIES